MNEMYLAQVRLRWIARDARAMLDRRACVCVAFNTDALDQRDLDARLLTKRMRRRLLYADYVWTIEGQINAKPYSQRR